MAGVVNSPYKIIVALDAPRLEKAINDFVQGNPAFKVISVNFAAGSGFIATLENERRSK